MFIIVGRKYSLANIARISVLNKTQVHSLKIFLEVSTFQTTNHSSIGNASVSFEINISLNKEMTLQILQNSIKFHLFPNFVDIRL